MSTDVPLFTSAKLASSGWLRPKPGVFPDPLACAGKTVCPLLSTPLFHSPPLCFRASPKTLPCSQGNSYMSCTTNVPPGSVQWFRMEPWLPLTLRFHHWGTAEELGSNRDIPCWKTGTWRAPCEPSVAPQMTKHYKCLQPQDTTCTGRLEHHCLHAYGIPVPHSPFPLKPRSPQPTWAPAPGTSTPTSSKGTLLCWQCPKPGGVTISVLNTYIFFFNVCWKGHNISFQWQGICKLTRDFKYRMKKKLHLHFIRSLNKPHQHPFLKDTCCGSAGNQSPFKFLVFQFWWILGWDYLFKNSTAKQLAQWHLLSVSTNLQESGHGLSLVIHSYTL